MLPQGGVVEAPRDHLVVSILHGVPGGDVLEQTTFCTEDLFCPGLHLMPLTEHAPRPAVPFP